MACVDGSRRKGSWRVSSFILFQRQPLGAVKHLGLWHSAICRTICVGCVCAAFGCTQKRIRTRRQQRRFVVPNLKRIILYSLPRHIAQTNQADRRASARARYARAWAGSSSTGMQGVRWDREGAVGYLCACRVGVRLPLSQYDAKARRSGAHDGNNSTAFLNMSPILLFRSSVKHELAKGQHTQNRQQIVRLDNRENAYLRRLKHL